ncbi:MAG: response regulator [Syntrophobacteraceae bacterium]
MKKQSHSFIVLMADDDEDDCLLVELAFKDMSNACDLRFVDDGRELLNYLYNRGDFSDPEEYPRPNLILLDLNMPRIDGREALTTIKSDPQLLGIPILIFTTSRAAQDIELAKQAGASSYLCKPEVLEDFTGMLSAFCTAIQHGPNIPFQVIGC